MEVLTTAVARALYGLPFVVFGLFHFMKGSEMGGYVPAWVPGGVFWVYFTGAAMLAAGIAIIAKKYAYWAGLGLALLLLLYNLTIHLPGMGDEAMSQMHITAFLKIRP